MAAASHTTRRASEETASAGPGWWVAACFAWACWGWLRFSCCEPGDNAASRGNQDGSTAAKQPEALPATFTNSLGMEFVLVPKGKSWLGGGGGKPGDKEVEIAHDFYLGKYEVTQEEWEKVMGINPSQSSRRWPGVAKEDLKRFPVENVSWDDCAAIPGAAEQAGEGSGLGLSLAEGGGMGVCLSGRAADATSSIARSTSTSTSRRTSCCRSRRTSSTARA